MPQPSALGTTIRDLRTARGLNKRELAEAAGVHPSYVSQLESGARQNASYQIVGALAEALGVTASEMHALARQTAEGPAAEGTVALHVEPAKAPYLRAIAQHPPDMLRRFNDFLVYVAGAFHQVRELPSPEVVAQPQRRGSAGEKTQANGERDQPAANE